MEVIRHFAGAITPDFSTNADFPDALKRYNTFRMRAFGHWLVTNNIPVTNNVRWGTIETWDYCFDGIPTNSIVSVGTVASGLHKLENRPASDIIAERASNLDLREHPIKNRSKTPLKAINRKIHDRTATKAEYKKHYQASRLKDRRKQAVRDFWKDERERLMHHQPSTSKWTKEQRDAILAGQRPKHDGKTIQGHHTYNVSKYPHLAGKSAIIYPATFNEHLKGWHGGNFKNSAPGRPIKNIRDF